LLSETHKILMAVVVVIHWDNLSGSVAQ